MDELRELCNVKKRETLEGAMSGEPYTWRGKINGDGDLPNCAAVVVMCSHCEALRVHDIQLLSYICWLIVMNAAIIFNNYMHSIGPVSSGLFFHICFLLLCP